MEREGGLALESRGWIPFLTKNDHFWFEDEKTTSGIRGSFAQPSMPTLSPLVLLPASRPFGRLPDGRAVESWRLVGKGGMEIRVLNYGCIITRILVPDRAGVLGDVALGFSSLEPYLARHPYFGAQVGRVAGRIRGAKFSLDGQVYRLAANDGAHHLHGGECGFDRRLWSVVPRMEDDGSPSVRLSYRSPDGEEGYPGQVDMEVAITVTPDNSLRITTVVAADRVTPVNPTHHSYFNLAGEGNGSVLGHVVEMDSASYVPFDETFALADRRERVGGGNDFRTPRLLAEALPGLAAAHGDLYRLENHGRTARVARVEDPSSGRVLEVSTDCDHLQFYTGVMLDGTFTGKSGKPYGAHAGFCLECQGNPANTDPAAAGNILVQPGKPRVNTTIYAFSTC